MAGGKQTPRQKMINMMYLVLLALLAMNVTNEVLNAFHMINNSLLTSNTTLGAKTSADMSDFQKLYEQNKVKAQEYWDKANRAKILSDTLYSVLEAYKEEIIHQAGGLDTEADNEIKQRDNLDVSTRLFVEESTGGEKRGKALQQKILDIRDSLRALSDGQVQISLDAPIPKVKEGTKKPWEYLTFHNVPATAAVTILSKFQNDDISSESAVIDYLKSKVGKTDFKFTDLTAKIIAPTSYVLDGQQYKADIFLAAYNKGQNPEVFLGPIGSFKKNPDGSYDGVHSDAALPPGYGSNAIKADGGFGKYETVGSGVGDKTYTGVIRVRDPAVPGYKFYPFEGKYQAAPKAVVVSPTKMNVLFIGVDNPMEISVPGVGQGDVSAILDGAGSLKKDPANPASYIANVTAIGKCKIAVSAKIDGKMMPMEAKEFRIKRIPDPVPSLGGKLFGGNTQPGAIKAQSGVVPLLKDFDFDARFTVISFEMVFSSKGEIFKEEAQGPLFSAKMKNFLDRAKPKDIIFIDEIKVVGPDKQPRKLGQIAFTII